MGNRIQAAPSPLPLDPYVRFINGVKAIIVLASTNDVSQHLVVDVPLDVFGLTGSAFFNVQTLFGSNNSSPQRVPANAMNSLGFQLNADKTAGGGALVIVITPTE